MYRQYRSHSYFTKELFKMSFDKRVIIIGAGVAGISAATRLFEHGLQNVIILEAQDRIGGRIHSVDLGDHGLVDLGAQWVHGEKGNVVYEIAESRDMLRFGNDFQNVRYVNSAGQVVNEEITDKANFIFYKLRHSDYSELVAGEEPISIGTCFNDLWNKELQNESLIPITLRASIFEWFSKFSNSIDGCDTWFDNSMSNFVEYVECEGDSLVNWKKGGYANILNLLMEKVNKITSGHFEEHNIKLNHKVSSLDWNSDGTIAVSCENGSSFKADHVVVTVPLAVLKNSYKRLFKFNLPDNKIQTIKGLGMGTVNKIFVFFPYRWWPDDVNGFSFLWKLEDKKIYEKKGLNWLTDVFGFYKVDTAPTALLGWVVGESARKMEIIPENELKSLLVDLLRKFLQDQYDIPDVTELVRSCWGTNSNIGGSYSYRTLLNDKMRTSSSELSIPINNDKGIPAVLFAGEATHPSYYSTVHGAIESGWQQADNIRQIYEKSQL